MLKIIIVSIWALFCLFVVTPVSIFMLSFTGFELSPDGPIYMLAGGMALLIGLLPWMFEWKEIGLTKSLFIGFCFFINFYITILIIGVIKVMLGYYNEFNNGIGFLFILIWAGLIYLSTKISFKKSKNKFTW